MRFCSALFGVIVLAGCDTPPAGEAPAAPTAVDFSTIPDAFKDAAIPAPHGGVDLRFDPTVADPVTAYADCSGRVLACLEATPDEWDTCVRSTPRCTTAEPWTEAECCPAACVTAYDDARTKGEVGFDAFMAVFVTDTACFPGLEAL